MNDGTSHTLANAELAVMDLLWNSDRSMTAREFRENLYPDQAQHGTVQRPVSYTHLTLPTILLV